MSLGTILLVVLILLLIGAIPSWPHSRNWGYGPSGGIGLVLVMLSGIILLILSVTGLVVYYDMWTRRRKAGKKGLFWS